jgi:shikimate kinase
VAGATTGRIVLVGLPGAGKSTAGALAAARLGWEFVDLDVEIERAAGLSVPEIFRAEGEAGFRRRERRATEALRGRQRLLLAPGGGWGLDPANREALGPGTSLVYLQVRPDVAAARLAGTPGTRPLLDGPDPVERLTELLRLRESFYLQADHTVTVDSMAPGDVASLIVALATGRRGD